jgi:hypothetical protein
MSVAQQWIFHRLELVAITGDLDVALLESLFSDFIQSTNAARDLNTNPRTPIPSTTNSAVMYPISNMRLVPNTRAAWVIEINSWTLIGPGKSFNLNY